MDRAIWIIDGNNLIQRDRTLRETLRRAGWDGACRTLESELAQLKRRKGRGTSVVVAYDGVAEHGERDRSTKGMRIVRAGVGRDADQVVLEEARRHEGRTQVHVVSDDRQDIGSKLRGLRVQWHSVEAFVTTELRRRRGGARSRGTSRSGGVEEDPADEKPAPPKGAEVDRWLQIFDPDPTTDEAE
ncbi:MAG: NYN domain-containing protein [Planctomycetota bacterium]